MWTGNWHNSKSLKFAKRHWGRPVTLLATTGVQETVQTTVPPGEKNGFSQMSFLSRNHQRSKTWKEVTG